MQSFISFMRAHVRGVSAVSAVAIVVLAVLLHRSPAPVADATVVQTAQAIHADVSDASSFTGTLEPVREVDIASKSGGLVTGLYAESGTRVGSGAIVARLDASQARATAASLSQDIEASQATLSATDAYYAQRIASAENGGASDAQTASVSALTDAAILAKQTDETLGNLFSLRAGAPSNNSSPFPEADLSARDGQAKITARADIASFQRDAAAFQNYFDSTILGHDPSQAEIATAIAQASALLTEGKTALSASYTALSATVSSASVSDATIESAKQDIGALGTQAQALLSRMHDTASGIDALKKEREAKIAEAQAQITALRGQQQVNETVLQDGTITAPFGGVITDKYAERGAVVAAGTPLVHLADDSRLRLVVGVPDASAKSYHVGDTATVILENGSASARVTKVSPTVDAASRKVLIELSIANGSHALTPGMYARAVFETSRSAQVAVPRAAVYTQYGTSYAFVLSDGIAHRRVVELGAMSDDLIEITRGVAAGETVVTSGVSFLRDGDRVSADLASATSTSR